MSEWSGGNWERGNGERGNGKRGRLGNRESEQTQHGARDDSTKIRGDVFVPARTSGHNPSPNLGFAYLGLVSSHLAEPDDQLEGGCGFGSGDWLGVGDWEEKYQNAEEVSRSSSCSRARHQFPLPLTTRYKVNIKSITVHAPIAKQPELICFCGSILGRHFRDR